MISMDAAYHGRVGRRGNLVESENRNGGGYESSAFSLINSNLLRAYDISYLYIFIYNTIIYYYSLLILFKFLLFKYNCVLKFSDIPTDREC